MREQFDTIAVSAPVGARPRRLQAFLDGAEVAPLVPVQETLRTSDEIRADLANAFTGPEQWRFQVDRLPEGVGYRQVHTPGRARPMVSASIPAAKKLRDGTVKLAGSTGLEGVSVFVGPWASEPVEYATVQVSAKALHGGENIKAGEGQRELAQALSIAGGYLADLGYRGPLDGALVSRVDTVFDFTEVASHARYVRSMYDNRLPRGMRRVGHGSETLAAHAGRAGMSRLYDKFAETKGDARAANQSRYEWQRRRDRLIKMGMSNVFDLDLARLDREARQVFEDQGLGNEVVPASVWAHKLLGLVIVDEDGVPLKGYSDTVRRGAMAWALLRRQGIDHLSPVNKNTMTKYRRLLAEVGCSLDDATLVEDGADAEVVRLDPDTLTEVRAKRRTPSRSDGVGAEVLSA